MHEKQARDYAWAKSFDLEISRLIGGLLVRPATIIEDTQEATDYRSDLRWYRAQCPELRIAARVRKPGAPISDVTFTHHRESGARCEWDKIFLDGIGDWFFYGHATAIEAGQGWIAPWSILDLVKMRPVIGSIPITKEDRNKDPAGMGCWFRAYHIADIIKYSKGAVLIAQSVDGWNLGRFTHTTNVATRATP